MVTESCRPLIRRLALLIASFTGSLAVACLAAPSPCHMGRVEVRRLPTFNTLTEPLEGGEYYFDGFLYSEFEDSGLIATPDALPALIEDLKLGAFCYRWASHCLEARKRLFAASRDRFIRLHAVVRYLGNATERDSLILTPHGCRNGTLEILRITSHSLVATGAPIGPVRRRRPTMADGALPRRRVRHHGGKQPQRRTKRP